MFLEQASMLKKVSFPRITLPSYVFLSASVEFRDRLGIAPWGSCS